jgi:hypothetical protein
MKVLRLMVKVITDNEGIACTLVTINKVRLLAIGILSKNNLAKKIHTHS